MNVSQLYFNEYVIYGTIAAIGFINFIICFVPLAGIIKLKKECRDMVRIQNRFVRHLMKTFEAHYRQMRGMTNAELYVAKRLSDCRICGFTLRGWNRMGFWGRLVGISLYFIFFVGSVYYFPVASVALTKHYLAAVFAAAVLTLLFPRALDCSYHFGQIRLTLCEYFSNCILSRLQKEVQNDVARGRGSEQTERTEVQSAENVSGLLWEQTEAPVCEAAVTQVDGQEEQTKQYSSESIQAYLNSVLAADAKKKN